MAATGMDHFTILTDQLDETIGFYREFLGLEPGDRPPFNFPGAWMYCNGRPVLHIVAGRPMPTERAGVLDHMAFSASGLADTVARLKHRGIAYDLRHLAGSGAWQVFFHDPNGARVELDFPASEAAPIPDGGPNPLPILN